MNKKIATLGLITSVAIIFGYVESLIPFFVGIPGIKLGLANLAILFVLRRFGIREAIVVSMIRILVIGFMFGNMASIIYSIAGAALSMAVMSFLLYKTKSSLYAVSMAGGISHNIGQLCIAMAIVENVKLSYYAPALIISGILTGILIGILTTEVIRRIP